MPKAGKINRKNDIIYAETRAVIKLLAYMLKYDSF
jgi:hypothetical protein